MEPQIRAAAPGLVRTGIEGLTKVRCIDLQWESPPVFETARCPERCSKTTAVPVGLPQSARCQVPWHLSIQTVARLHRSGAVQARAV